MVCTKFRLKMVLAHPEPTFEEVPQLSRSCIKVSECHIGNSRNIFKMPLSYQERLKSLPIAYVIFATDRRDDDIQTGYTELLRPRAPECFHRLHQHPQQHSSMMMMSNLQAPE